ncbi:hypothetical protein OHX09_15100 [Acinetobacter baumannii]|nr:hypothetical protein [Acinetobacter baumannii]
MSPHIATKWATWLSINMYVSMMGDFSVGMTTRVDGTSQKIKAD